MNATYAPDLTPVLPRKYRPAFMMLVLCFALWGLVNAMAEVLVKAFESIFPQLSQMGTVMTVTSHYGAYALLAIPAAMFIKAQGYRRGVLLGLGVFMIGVLGYVPAAIWHSYDLCLISIFVYASGLSVLETACNPYVLAMGPAETAVRRLNFAQQFNPVGNLVGLVIARYVIFENMEQAQVGVQLSSEQQTQNLVWLVTPYVVLAAIVALLWISFRRVDIPAIEAPGITAKHSAVQSILRLLRVPRYVCGVIAQFFYVGLQTMIWVYVLHYAAYALHYTDAEAMYAYIAAVILFILFRFISTALMRFCNPCHMMALFATLGIAFCAGAMWLPGMAGLACVVCISGCMSLMFPTIYGVALRDLGEDSKVGSAGLVMAILGGAALPPVFAYYLGHETLAPLVNTLYTGQEAALRGCYVIPAVCLAIVLLYSLLFGKMASRHPN